jgi:hypothetical protein
MTLLMFPSKQAKSLAESKVDRGKIYTKSNQQSLKVAGDGNFRGRITQEEIQSHA